MKATKTIISTLREAPNDAVIASHQLMMRSGLIRKLGNGLYAYMPFGFRSLMKGEAPAQPRPHHHRLRRQP